WLTAAVVTAGGRGGGHLPPPRAGLACVPRRSREPRPTQSHVGDRALPNGSAGRSCRTLRGLCAPAHFLQLLPQPALPEVPSRRCQRVVGRPPGRTAAGALLPCRLYAARSDRGHSLSQQGNRL